MLVFSLAVGFALVVSFFCSIAEASLLSVSPAQIESLGRTRVAEILRRFKREIDQPVAAVLVLNTVANTAGASVAGWSYGQVFDESTLWVFSTCFTLAVLCFAEIVPKTLGVTKAGRVAPAIAHPVKMLTVALRPLLVVTRALSKLIRGGADIPVTSLEDIRLLAALGRTEGALGARVADMIEGATRLRELRARDVMLPRTAVVFLSGERTLQQNLATIRRSGHSRFPYSATGQLDRVEGIVVVKDLMFQLNETPGRPEWEHLMSKPLMVPEAMPLDRLLRTFQDERRHLAMVLDEYGGVSGIVTMEDVLEEIVGEIEDETDRVNPFIIKRSDGRLLCRGWAEARKMLEAFDLDDELDAVSVGGFVAELVGRVPVVGDTVRFRGLELRVLAASPRRAERVEVRRIAPPSSRPDPTEPKPP